MSCCEKLSNHAELTTGNQSLAAREAVIVTDDVDTLETI